jgi:hypothetical protein
MLLGLVVGGLLVVTWVRRRVRGDANVHGEGFTFSDLRQLRKQGKITELEYQRVKAALTASITPAVSPAEPGAPATGAPPPGVPPVPRRSPPQS